MHVLTVDTLFQTWIDLNPRSLSVTATDFARDQSDHPRFSPTATCMQVCNYRIGRLLSISVYFLKINFTNFSPLHLFVEFQLVIFYYRQNILGLRPYNVMSKQSRP